MNRGFANVWMRARSQAPASLRTPLETKPGQTRLSCAVQPKQRSGFQTAAFLPRQVDYGHRRQSGLPPQLRSAADTLDQKKPYLPLEPVSLQEDRPASNARQRFLLQIRPPWLTGSFCLYWRELSFHHRPGFTLRSLPCTPAGCPGYAGLAFARY